MKGIKINDSKCYGLWHFFVIDNSQIQENKVPMLKTLGLLEKNCWTYDVLEIWPFGLGC